MSAAHLHLLLNHVPVTGTLIGLCLLAYAVLRDDEALVRASLALFVAMAAVGLLAFATGDPAEHAVEGLAGVSGPLIERHEEAALLATLALGLFGAAALGALLSFRGRGFPRLTAVLFLLVALVPAGAMAWTARLGGQIRHPEVRPASAQAGVAQARTGQTDEGGERHR